MLQHKQIWCLPYRTESQVQMSFFFAFQSTVSVWQNAEQREFYQRLIETVAVLHRLANRLSSRAEMVGAVRQVRQPTISCKTSANKLLMPASLYCLSCLRGQECVFFPADKPCLWKVELNVMLALKVNVWAKVNFVNGEALRSAWLCIAHGNAVNVGLCIPKGLLWVSFIPLTYFLPTSISLAPDVSMTLCFTKEH